MWNFFDPFEPGGEKRDSVHRTHTHTHARDEEFSFRPVWRASNVTKRGTVMAGGLKHQR